MKLRTALIIVAIFALVFVAIVKAFAREGDDHGNHGNLKAWFDHLASGKGSCCSFADGQRVDDVDWDTTEVCDGNMAGGSGNAQQRLCQPAYRVRLHGEWIVVPPNAVITEPNKYGPAVVWPYADLEGITQIRCFMPGAGA